MKLSAVALSASLFLAACPGSAAVHSHARISMKSAEKQALKSEPGKVESEELQQKSGKWIYSFDIRGPDRKLHEVHVDARSGKVISNKTG